MYHFKYELNDALASSIQSNVAKFNDMYVPGILDEALLSSLIHCSLYIICEHVDEYGQDIYYNPIAVVGRNEDDAMNRYLNGVQISEGSNGFIFCKAEDRCDRMKVLPA